MSADFFTKPLWKAGIDDYPLDMMVLLKKQGKGSLIIRLMIFEIIANICLCKMNTYETTPIQF